MEELLVYPFPALGVQMEIKFVRGLAQHRVSNDLTVGSIPQGDRFLGRTMLVSSSRSASACGVGRFSRTVIRPRLFESSTQGAVRLGFPHDA